jgi:CRISPR-associated protein Csx14
MGVTGEGARGEDSLTVSASSPDREAVLIAPLSSKPQLVTLAMDRLRARGGRVREIVALHTNPARPATHRAVTRLGAECEACYPNARLRAVCLCDDRGIPFDDVDSQAAAKEAFRVLYREVKAVKQAGRRVHLSIAGGRKILAVYGMAVAQMLFEPDDRVWHLVSTPDLIAREALHAEPEESSLIRVPVLRWSEVSPVLTELAVSDDPFEAVRRQEAFRRADAVRRARHYVEQVLTPAEREVVALVVREGLTDAQIGARTYRSPKTVGHHLSAAYRKARETFGLTEVDRHTLTSLLATYFARDL